MIRPSLDPADAPFVGGCVPPELTPVPEPCPVPEPYSYPRLTLFQTFQKGPALYLAFRRGPAFQTFQTFQKESALYLVFVFAAAGLCLPPRPSA
ncbi:unnamed protein product [Boreogadus saida]